MMPKTLQPWADRISEYEDDRANQNGHWVHLKDGWINLFSETHMIHEDTVKECVEQMRHWVKRCLCEQCTSALSTTVKK